MFIGIGKPAKDTESSKTLSKKDKKKKKGGADDDDMCYFAGDTEDTRPKIPVETAPVKGAVTVEQPVLDSDQEEEGSKIREVKSAAEKKAEKKKRDAEKRKAEKLKEEERLRKLAEQQAKNVSLSLLNFIVCETFECIVSHFQCLRISLIRLADTV